MPTRLNYNWKTGFENDLLAGQNLETECFEKCWKYPESLGSGYFKRIVFRPGFEMWISECRFMRDVFFSSFSWPSLMIFGFYLCGHYKTTLGKTSKPHLFSGEQQTILYLKEPIGKGWVKTGVPLKNISIMVNPHLLRTYFQGQTQLPDVLTRIFSERSTETLLYHQNRIAPEMHTALQEILDCQLNGLARKFYLESKALELIARNLSEISDTVPRQDIPALHPLDLRQTEYARQILMDNLESPPDLRTLARSAGMSHPKLNRCFKKRYGMTVFQYLRNERLNRARTLLLDQHLTVTEAAVSVGYDSLSHFSMAYKKQFGVSPGHFPKSSHRKTA